MVRIHPLFEAHICMISNGSMFLESSAQKVRWSFATRKSSAMSGCGGGGGLGSVAGGGRKRYFGLFFKKTQKIAEKSMVIFTENNPIVRN